MEFFSVIDTGESYDDEDDLSYTEEDIANSERTRGGAVYHGDEYVYIQNHTLSTQDLMPLGEEDDDGAILMLQGPQRSESITYSIIADTLGLHWVSVHDTCSWLREDMFLKAWASEGLHYPFPLTQSHPKHQKYLSRL